MDVPTPEASLLEFLGLWALVYGAHIVVYFAVGYFLIWFNGFFPEKRIPAIGGRNRRARMSDAAEIRQSVKTLLSTAFCTSASLYMQHLGWTQTPLELTPISALWTFAATVVIFDLWLYVEHRLMHTKLLYRPFHLRHHRAVAPSVWTNDAFTVTEAFVIQAFFILLPFILPIPPLVLIFCRLFDQVKGMIGHSGYEHFAGRLSRAPSPLIATLHHDLHHQRFTVNFGNQTSFWDRVFGTLDPDYDRLIAEISEKGAAAVGAESQSGDKNASAGRH